MSAIAVVILNYNGKRYLEKFLPSVVNHSKSAQIIVADNASTDDSVHFLKEKHPEVELILLDKNFGYAGGYNEALKKVDAKYLVLLNSDVEVTANWLDPMVSFLEKNERYVACQPKIKDFNHKDQFEYAGACGGFIDSLGYPYCRGRIFDKLEIDSGQYDDSIDIFWTSGACMVIKKEVFHEVGEFDADFFAHMEEIDLCWRLNSKGLKLKSIPSSTVYHVGGGTLSKISPKKTFLNFRNGMNLLIKNLPVSNLLLKAPIRMILDWVAAIKFLLDGDSAHAMAVLKAQQAVLKSLISTLKKRNLVSNIPSRRNVLWNYFIRNRRNYSDLH